MASYVEAKKVQVSNANSITIVAKSLSLGDSAIGGYKTCIPDWCELLGNPSFCKQFKDVIVHIPEKDIISAEPTGGDRKDFITIQLLQDANILLERMSSIRAKDLKGLKGLDVFPPTTDGGDGDEVGVAYNKVLDTVVKVVIATLVKEALDGPTVGDLMKIAKEQLEKG